MTLPFFSGLRLAVAALVLMVCVFIANGCGSSRAVSRPPGDDEVTMRLNRSARIAHNNGQLEQAANLYRQALNRAYLRDDHRAVIDAQYNLAVCMLGLRSYDQALEWVHRAQNELARSGKRISADILLLEAVALFRTGRADEAWQISDRILTAPEKPPAMVEGKTYFLRGLIADQRGDIDQLARQIEALAPLDNFGARADRHELNGRLAMAGGNWAAAIEVFDQTAELRRENRDYTEMSQALALAAEACQRADKPAAAASRYFRAGRSAAQQNYRQDAMQWLKRAVELAGQAGDEALKKEVENYLDSIASP